MKCRECGTEIAEKALICFRCGASVQEAIHKPYVVKKRRPFVVYAIFILLVLIAILVALFRLNTQN